MHFLHAWRVGGSGQQAGRLPGRARGAARAQGVAKQGLQRQKEAYAAKWRDLEERACGLEDALRSQRQAAQEREEQNAGLHAQVRDYSTTGCQHAQAYERLKAGHETTPAPDAMRTF